MYGGCRCNGYTTFFKDKGPLQTICELLPDLATKFCASHDLVDVQRITIDNFVMWVKQQQS
jgi:hypothetical protein